MIYTLNPSIAQKTQIRILGILGFALLTGIGAQISIPRQPVPVTLQVLAVLLAGLTLGARDGFMSQIAYLAAIVAGLLTNANGLSGKAAFDTASTGYLYAFPLAAGLVGLLAVRNNFWIRGAACLAGIVLIYIIGTSYLKLVYFDWLDHGEMSWRAAWSAGVAPFIVIDLAKAVIATGSGEALRGWWQHQYPQ